MGDVINMPIFHLHFPHHHQHHPGKKEGIVPKGYFAVLVGQGEDERQRFVVPVVYLNHPLFVQLLKEAEEEYGFEQKGAIAIPCHVAQFRYVQSLIDRGRQRHHVGCFRA